MMSLISNWRDMTNQEMTPKEHKEFWDGYYALETAAYKRILGRKEEYFEDKLSSLAEEFGMDDTVFAGFMDGINTSLVKE